MAPPAPTLLPKHQRLAALVGRYTGRTLTWLDPPQPPDEGDAELRVESVLGGRWVRFEEHGLVAGKSHAGELLVGYQAEPAEWQASWIDTFHTGGAIILSTGAPREDALIAVTGSYPAGPVERWGWRTEMDPPDADGAFTMRAINITPAGEEYPAIETRWHR